MLKDICEKYGGTYYYRDNSEVCLLPTNIITLSIYTLKPLVSSVVIPKNIHVKIVKNREINIHTGKDIVLVRIGEKIVILEK